MTSLTEQDLYTSVRISRVGNHVIFTLPANPDPIDYRWIEKDGNIGGSFTLFINAQAWGHRPAHGLTPLAGLALVPKKKKP